MKIRGLESTEEIIKEIGKRIKDKRISMNLTQYELSQRSGLSPRSISDLENGSNLSLKSLIPVMKALGIISNLDLLVTESALNPYDALEHGRNKERVRKSKQKSNEWKWGDEK